ncbi:SMI1/KNR4 family protein [Tateyamaria sp.]|uniref:SMI1/KNR4 family protein n=1 Tax=Tateyamaria sp. TaxID=1929288 RepID=UPI00329D7B4B
MKVFSNFDLRNFWSGGNYERDNYVGALLRPDLVASVERELGYQLPQSYVELMSVQNGGKPNNTCHPTAEETSWANDHVAITGISAIDRRPIYSLCGELGSKFMMEEWGYPPIGVYFADCPSAGHDMLCLDYRNVRDGGEPTVVHVDQDSDFQITFVARNFEAFVRGLRHKDTFSFED